MHFEFGVYNPKTGIINRAKTLDEAKAMFIDTSFEFLMEYFHHTPWVNIRVNDDGSETWNMMSPDFIVAPEEQIKELKDLLYRRMEAGLPSFNEVPQSPTSTGGATIVTT